MYELVSQAIAVTDNGWWNDFFALLKLLYKLLGH